MSTQKEINKLFVNHDINGMESKNNEYDIDNVYITINTVFTMQLSKKAISI